MSAPTLTPETIDARLRIWREVMLTAINDADPAGELEAAEEIDRLLDLRLMT